MAYCKYSNELLAEAVAASYSYAEVLRYLGLKQTGGSQAHYIRRIKEAKIDTSHFTGQSHLKGKHSSNKKKPEEVLVLRDSSSRRVDGKRLKQALIELGVEEKCACGLTTEWNGTKLTLEIDHINGMWWDNRKENLRFICPNCHSQCVTTNRPHKYRPA